MSPAVVVASNPKRSMTQTLHRSRFVEDLSAPLLDFPLDESLVMSSTPRLPW